MTYDWDLMLRLLREAQKSGNESFTPRQYADEHALAVEEARVVAGLKSQLQSEEAAASIASFPRRQAPPKRQQKIEHFVVLPL